MTHAHKPSHSSRRARLALSTVTLMLAYGLTPSECFGTKTIGQRVRPESRRYFRTLDESLEVESGVASTLFNNAFLPRRSSAPTDSRMPTWLSHSEGHLYERNMARLHEAMMNSFFTEKEAMKVAYAIEEAASGDKNKMAGAAEFCLIVVESTEMGLSALIAAAFHYCSCVSARERSMLLPEGILTSSVVWEQSLITAGVESFGKVVVDIAQDAARLKKLEMVASMVVQNSGNNSRVSPYSRDAENLRKLLLTEVKDWRSLAIRSAACLYRLRGILKTNSPDLTLEAVRVSREALYIYAQLASRLGMHRLKSELEDAAFQILYRRQYERVTSLSSKAYVKNSALYQRRGLNVGESMQQVLDEVANEMTEMLEDDAEFKRLTKNFSVTARVKEPYSMWKKMLRQRAGHVLEVPDAMALRVVLEAKKLTPDEDGEVTRARERALCYYVQKRCTQRWRASASNPRFKDYIERPKANGYQSLHYTAVTTWSGEDWTLEIQVRSAEMHRVAEFGLASHWEYKAQKKSKQSQPFTVSIAQQEKGTTEDHSSDAYLRSLQEWHWQQHGGAKAPSSNPEPLMSEDDVESKERAARIRARTQRLQPYIEALTAAQSDLVRQNVFVFLAQSENSTGSVVALPAGACVLDALREGERRFSMRFPWKEEDLALVSHNGVAASVTSKLRNGDILSVPGVSM
jgi:ppGpp synthetase/RelA/SpoT-type nucleotidyltranferase